MTSVIRQRGLQKSHVISPLDEDLGTGGQSLLGDGKLVSFSDEFPYGLSNSKCQPWTHVRTSNTKGTQ